MTDQLIWGFCIALEFLLLLRSVQTSLFRKFIVFFSYLACILSVDLLSTFVYKLFPSFYSPFYWGTDLLLAVLGYGVIMEMYQNSLKGYAGVSHFIRIVLFVIFGGITAKVGLGLLRGYDISLINAIADLERYLRLMQAGLLVSLLALLLYYRIPLGRNLRGLILGYTFFIGSNVILFTFISHPANRFAVLMREIEPTFYLIALCIWLISTWSYQPEPVAEAPAGIEHDYELLVRETRMMLARARTQLARTVRP
jgi:hypothetical protein